MRLEERNPSDPAAQACLAQYYAELDGRFPGGFKVELSRDPDAADLVRPRGSFIVAFDADQPVGCVALKGTDLGYGEIKRMWIAPSARGSGLARDGRRAGDAGLHSRLGRFLGRTPAAAGCLP